VKFAWIKNSVSLNHLPPLRQQKNKNDNSSARPHEKTTLEQPGHMIRRTEKKVSRSKVPKKKIADILNYIMSIM
jgi:hypothetical protein